MPAFTYSHRYLQFLTDRLVNQPQYQQQLHRSIGTGKKEKIVNKLFKKICQLDRLYSECVIQMPAFTYPYPQFLTDWLVTLHASIISRAGSRAVRNELLSIAFVFRNGNI